MQLDLVSVSLKYVSDENFWHTDIFRQVCSLAVQEIASDVIQRLLYLDQQ